MSIRRRWEIRESVPLWGCLLLGALVGLLTFVFCPFVMEAAAKALWGGNYISGLGVILGSEKAVLGVLLLIDSVAAYVVGRVVFMRLRWRAVWTPTPFCSRCDYDLTGNVSGVCPECGAPVPVPGRGGAGGRRLTGKD